MTFLACIVFTLWQPQCPYSEALSQAIFVAEGSESARVPFGILSVPVRDTAHAHELCIETINVNWVRFQRAGKPGGDTPDAFVAFLAARYCPRSADPVGYRNWRRNVTRLLNSRLTAARPVVFSVR